MTNPVDNPHDATLRASREARQMDLRIASAKRSTKAFTLVETVLAMGIVVFAMLPILGLVPVGLGSLREAISSTVESQIVQAVSNEILLTKFDTIIKNYSKPVTTYYNEEGTLLPANGEQKLYTVTVVLKDVSAPADSIVNPVTSTCALLEIIRADSPLKANRHTLLIPKA